MIVDEDGPAYQFFYHVEAAAKVIERQGITNAADRQTIYDKAVASFLVTREDSLKTWVMTHIDFPRIMAEEKFPDIDAVMIGISRLTTAGNTIGLDARSAIDGHANAPLPASPVFPGLPLS